MFLAPGLRIIRRVPHDGADATVGVHECVWEAVAGAGEWGPRAGAVVVVKTVRRWRRTRPPDELVLSAAHPNIARLLAVRETPGEFHLVRASRRASVCKRGGGGPRVYTPHARPA